jgi:LuxR family maltose regulon positive regulatory protein
MATLVLSTKLFVPPKRPQSVPRQRLLQRLGDGRAAGRKLTLISAPAGFGKSTLVSDWMADIAAGDLGARVAWVSLDRADNDPSRFLTYLTVALGLSPTMTGGGPPESIVTEIINEIGQAEFSTILVLDDFQVLDAAPVREAMSYLLEHQPPNLHVVLASRSDPLLPLSRMRSSGALTELRAADLRFTPDESTTFLNSVMGLDLPATDIAALVTRTEGWIAGLQLAALSMREHSDVAGFINAFTGSNRFVIDYLGEEVLQRLPHAVRSFLLQTAFLERMNVSLCNAVTGRTDGEEMLDTLERENLFLVPLDDKRHWYRYHNLFADVLRARSLREDRDHLIELNRLASAWHEVNDLPEYAVEYALAGNDFHRAAQLIEQALPGMRRQRQDSTLIAWLKLLPDDTASRMPVLRAFSAWAMFVAGDLDGADRRFSEVERSLDSPAGHGSAAGEELTKLPVTIAAYRAAIAQARGDINATEVHARRTLALSPAEDYLGRGAGGGLLALALWAKGNLGAAVPTFRDAMASLELAGHLTDAVSGTVVMADMLAVQGRRVAAREAFDRALALTRTGQAGWTVDLHPGMSELAREADDIEGAERHLTAATPPDAHAGVPENRYRWFVAMSRVREAQGEFHTAGLLLDEAERLYLLGYFPNVRPIAAMRARIWIKQGRLADAAVWARENLLSVRDDTDYMREFQHITLARLLVSQFRTARNPTDIVDAMTWLERLLAVAQAGGRSGSVYEILVLQALGFEAQGRILDAMSPLRAALVLAQPEGYVRLFTDEGVPMAALLDEAGRRAILPNYVRRLRRSFATPVALDTEPGGTLSERELTVLRLLITELTGPEIASELFISLNTLRSHTKHIFEKLAVSSRPAAVRRAHEQGLI